MGKKIQIGVGGAPIGAGTAFDPERVIDYLKSGSEKQTENRNMIMQNSLSMGSIDGEIAYCG